MQWPEHIYNLLVSQVLALLPPLIVMWGGGLGNIPEGWQLCDGTNDTPDLRDRFLIGAGDTYNPDNTGGDLEHDHDAILPPHVHVMLSDADIKLGAGWSATTSVGGLFFATDPASSLAPYLALAYIMKV